ncbi:exosortase U [Stieleria varia]|uniref:Transmembrane exosortase n=1 Tax=Stieleria varia TaxID=2528005 RepID=A0A5C6AYD3_9BACT|nr:exosortase U [Stieleria varia]TWU04668.1 Transmembrane exosortase [Stieleria varia]
MNQPTEPSVTTRPTETLWLDYRWPLLIALAHLPLLIVHLINLFSREQYQHFPMVLLAFGILVFNRLEPIPAGKMGPIRRQGAFLCWIIALGLFGFGTFVFSPWVAAVGFVISVGGILLSLRERFQIHNAFGLWLILWLLIPVPGGYEQRLSQSLQQWTTTTSASILQAVYIPNIVEGTTIQLPSQRLFVEEACSGIVSMMAILATCLLMAVLANRSLLHMILLVASGLLWASVMNIVRIVSIGVFSERYGIDMAAGWPHTALGLVVFTGAVILVVSSDQLLCFLMEPGDAEKFDRGSLSETVLRWIQVVEWGSPEPVFLEDETLHMPTHPGKFGTPTRVFSILFLLIGMTGLAMGLNRLRTGQEIAFTGSIDDVDRLLNENLLPTEVGGWKRTEFRDEHVERLFAQQSRVWVYRKDSLVATFAVDFAFPQWHDLCDCYQKIGWQQDGVSQVAQTATEQDPYLSSNFYKGTVSRGLLRFCLTEKDGVSISPPEALGPLGKLRQRMENDRTLFQIQLWVTKDGEFLDREAEDATKLFEHLHGIVTDRLAGQSGLPPAGTNNAATSQSGPTEDASP